MTQTSRIGLPYLQPSQAQKHATVNDAFQRLDGLLHVTVLSASISVQPQSPQENDAYILPAVATGAQWGAMPTGSIAFYQEGRWRFVPALVGWQVYDSSTRQILIFEAEGWTALTGLDSHQSPQVGVNVAPSSQNRLSVNSQSVLFSYDPEPANTGDIRLYLNKADASSTASVVFEEGYSARAEIGLTGGSSFNFKVNSLAGWIDAMIVDVSHGNVGIGTAQPLARLDVTTQDGPLPTIASAVLLRLLNQEGQQTTFITDAIGNNPDMSLRRTNGSASSPTAVVAGNNLGQISWLGFDGNGYSASQARIQADAAEDWTPSKRGTHLDFAVTATGSTGRAKRMRIAASGNVAIRDDLNPACKLDVDGPVRVGEYAVADLPAASAGAGQIIYVADEAGGAVLAFSDGINWRRTSDRAVVS